MGGADLPSLRVRSCPRAPTGISVPVPPGFPVRIHKAPGSNPEPTPALFFVPFPLVGRAVGCLVGEQERNHKKATPVANFRRRLQNFRRGGLW